MTEPNRCSECDADIVVVGHIEDGGFLCCACYERLRDSELDDSHGQTYAAYEQIAVLETERDAALARVQELEARLEKRADIDAALNDEALESPINLEKRAFIRQAAIALIGSGNYNFDGAVADARMLYDAIVKQEED